jgi:hypothetical protein
MFKHIKCSINLCNFFTIFEKRKKKRSEKQKQEEKYKTRNLKKQNPKKSRIGIAGKNKEH